MKIMNMLVKKAGLSQADFEDYWHNVHGPIVRRHADAINLRRYVQIHQRHTEFTESVNGPRQAGKADPVHYDGAVELHWDSYAAFLESFETEAGKAAWAEIAADEPKFADSSRSYMFVGEDKVIVG